MSKMRAGVVIPYRPGQETRSVETKEAEAVGLIRAIHIDPIYVNTLPLRETRPSTLFGKGTVGQLSEDIAAKELELVVVDGSLSPIQQRNLEKKWQCKVLDRTALILEIFGERARTKEGKLQVELASLNYQKSRLVRSWTHLERQRGGAGFMGGPGETQIESDRRMLNDRIVKLRKQLEQVTRTRRLQRESRRKIPYPIVALVGYTNAGKSTLFNRLTEAKVLAEDQVFATLDPTLRKLVLPSGIEVILSDTVGFISNLPTELVAAFRATLEEVVEADLLLHIRDSADPDHEVQKREVEDIIHDLCDQDEKPVIEVMNKVDCLPEDETVKGMAVSALDGTGVSKLLAEIDHQLQQILGYSIEKFKLKPQQAKARAWLHEHTEILGEEVNEEGEFSLTIRISAVDLQRFHQLFMQS